jgi:hypothetical protein
MLFGAEVAVCSEINIKQINALWAKVQFLTVKPDGAKNQ